MAVLITDGAATCPAGRSRPYATRGVPSEGADRKAILRPPVTKGMSTFGQIERGQLPNPQGHHQEIHGLLRVRQRDNPDCGFLNLIICPIEP